MTIVRVEVRNVEGRVVSVLEKDFTYINSRHLYNWIKDELVTALDAHHTIRITSTHEDPQQ